MSNKQLTEKIAALEARIAVLEAAQYAPLPIPYYPVWPNGGTYPTYPYAPPIWYSTMRAGTTA